MRFLKNFSLGCKMLWQRLNEGTYVIVPSKNKDDKYIKWYVNHLPVFWFPKPMMAYGNKRANFMDVNSAIRFAQENGAHFNIEVIER